MILMVIFLVSLVISFVLIFLNSGLGTKNDQSREKSSAFECGFDPKCSSRLPFSLHFFLVALIFLIFDVEITLLLPIPLMIKFSNHLCLSLISSLFVGILVGGVFIEWNEGALDWSY